MATLGARLYGPESRGQLDRHHGATRRAQRRPTRASPSGRCTAATVITWDLPRHRRVNAPTPAAGFDGNICATGASATSGAMLQLAATRFRSRAGAGGPASVGRSSAGREHTRIARALTVGSQLGSWRLWPGFKKWAMAALWHACGDARRHARARPLPRAARHRARPPAQRRAGMARWGRSDSFLGQGVSRDGFERLRAPVLSPALTDDDYAPAPPSTRSTRSSPRERRAPPRLAQRSRHARHRSLRLLPRPVRADAVGSDEAVPLHQLSSPSKGSRETSQRSPARQRLIPHLPAQLRLDLRPGISGGS